MPTTQITLPPPTTHGSNLSPSDYGWEQLVQNAIPLNLVDTSKGSYAESAPTAGVATSGQSGQCKEITYVKTSSDANTYTLNGVQGGPYTLSTQYQFLKIKSDGTNWWLDGQSGSTAPAGAYVKLQEVILAAPAPTISFASIPQIYRNLKLLVTGMQSGAGETFYLQFNGDVGANYGSVNFFGGATQGSGTNYSSGEPPAGCLTPSSSPTGQAASNETTIFDYARTLWNKNFSTLTARADGGFAGPQYVISFAGTWNNTDAITSILLGLPGIGNIEAGTVASLYGIL